MDRLLLDSDKVKHPQNPRENANIFEILTFSWLINLFKMGMKKDLEENDLYAPLQDHMSSLLGNELEKKWRVEQDISYKTNRRPSFLRVLIQMLGAKYMFCGCLIAVNELILKMAQPLCIAGFLSYFNTDNSNKTEFRQVYIWASSFLLGMFITSTLFHSLHMEIYHYGMKMRVACCSIIYRKALRLGHTALGETTVGQVVNLMSNDVNRFDSALTYIHYLWIGPLQTVMITYFVWQEIGVSSLIGVVTLLVFIPLQGWFGKKIAEFRLKTAKFTDDRVRLMNEIILGIQVIKMYVWEKPFANLMEQVRRKEIQQIRGSLIIKIISQSFYEFQTKLQVFVMILSYVLLGNYISVEKVYVVTSYYSLLRLTMGFFFSYAPGQLAELLVSIKRIQHFLIHIERDNQISKFSNSLNDLRSEPNELSTVNDDDTKKDIQDLNNIGIVVSNATAKWAYDQTDNTLENINLNIGPGRLVAVIGSVGAGKSSLLQAILGELPLSEGNISIHGVVSYASQEPWLFSGSVLDNIIFHSPMDKQRYKQVIKACALKTDLKSFPYGDRTIVGERGVTLSGGQRARINLARAIYKKADIYLLDDPLSAVDTRIGKYLFEMCIKGYLKEKTCILITHQIQFLANVDHILLMENASIKSTGSYHELIDYGFDFSKLLGFPEETIVESHIKCENANKKKLNTNHTLSRSGDNIKSFINRDTVKPMKEEEAHCSGHVSKKIYLSYYSSCGSIIKIVFVVLIFTLGQVITAFDDIWISVWVNEEENIFRNVNNTISLNSTLMDHGSFDQRNNWTSNLRFIRIIVNTVITVAFVMIIIVRSVIFVSACTSASINLHNTMFNAVTRTSMRFFHTNSLGRIFNRFSKDIGAIDESLPFILLYCLQTTVKISGIIFIVGLVNIFFTIPSIIILVLFYYLRTLYLPTSRSVKRLEGIARSPIYGHLAASVQGLNTVRAHKTEKFLIQEFDKHQDFHSSAWFTFISINQAFGFWTDYVCLIYMSIVTLSFLFMEKYITGANVGLTITQLISLVGSAQWGLRQSVLLESEMTSVERVNEYSNLPQETTLQSAQDKFSSKGWPNRGKIMFQRFSLRYSKDAPNILKNLNFTIEPKEKVGIVGRTGAGKSSIIAALFRLAFNEGKIFIDETEIHSLGLHELRSKISIIPQEPILFSGTMRTNLDPFSEYPDHTLWDALDKIELKRTIENLPGGLDTKMSGSGSNFSVGQRQLVCLARAIIRNNKILVLDEATANVDLQTDALIQNAIRNHFETCTVLTIAHRLNTVMDSDKIIVMEEGRMVEFDHSYNLLKNKDGYFYKMVEQAGQFTANSFKRIAAESYKSIKTKLLV